MGASPITAELTPSPPVRMTPAGREAAPADHGSNRLHRSDRAAHDWYHFVLSFPAHLVRDNLEKLQIHPGQLVLDPFCGTGTTLVECKKNGIASIGIEANPLAHFASTVKTDWSTSGRVLLRRAGAIADAAGRELGEQGYPDEPAPPLFCGNGAARPSIPLRSLEAEAFAWLLHGSISPLPLHKTLILLERIDQHAPPVIGQYCRLALARALVEAVGNLHLGPEVGVGKPKADVAVVGEWWRRVSSMAVDLDELRSQRRVSCRVLQADARDAAVVLAPGSIAAVITSPPYPNEKDYTRTTRLESVILGFIRNKAQLRELKQSLVRSNTRNVYQGDDDERWVTSHKEIRHLADRIERRRIELNKTSGFERMYASVTRLYFGGMAKHLAGLRSALRPGARLAYVVGDQALYLRLLIKTGAILATIAESLGYRVTGIDLFRTHLATATREQLREEVVCLEWPGEARPRRQVEGTG